MSNPLSLGPTVGQLGRRSPSKASRKWVIFEDDTVRTINSAANTTLIQSDLRDVDFHSRVTMHFWSRVSTQAVFPAGEVLVIEPFRIVAGVTTVFTYPIYYRAPPGAAVNEVLTLSKPANTQAFIHMPGTPVIYGIRARIDARTTSSINCRMYGIRLEWEPEIVTR